MRAFSPVNVMVCIWSVRDCIWSVVASRYGKMIRMVQFNESSLQAKKVSMALFRL